MFAVDGPWLTCGRWVLLFDKYKYLGVILDEFLNFESRVQVLSEAAGRALGAVILKFKTLKDIGF